MATARLSCPCFLRCKLTPEEIEMRYRSQEIDKMIEKDKQSTKRQVKVLLLGAGESGKSTFLKQMRIIHNIQFEPELVKEFQHVIYQNIIRGMKVLVDARDKLQIPWGNPANSQRGKFVLSYQNGDPLDSVIFQDYVVSLYHLWNDSGIKRAFERRREFQLSDSVQYFLNNLDRISRTDYRPSNQDILHARKATKGISEFVININKIPFRFVDVGGQRSQRQKWIQCFDSVTSILFLVSSSEYDQMLVEDRQTNRLEESKVIFETLVKNKSFHEMSIILFLNKTDLLKEKLQSRETNIKMFFPKFSGDPWSLADVQQFTLDLFLSVLKNDEDKERNKDRIKDGEKEKPRRLFHHFTTAVDTENIKVVFNAVKDTILQRNLQSLMLQ